MLFPARQRGAQKRETGGKWPRKRHICPGTRKMTENAIKIPTSILRSGLDKAPVPIHNCSKGERWKTARRLGGTCRSRNTGKRPGKYAWKERTRSKKQLWKKLVLCVLTLALCCNLVPMAFAADASYYNVYLEAQGDTCDVMQLYAYKYGSNYRLTSTPTPTMEGYKFDGWYDDVVGGTKITTRYNFKDDTTIYAHWTPTAKKNTATATAAKTTTTAPAAADTEKSWKLKDNLGTVLVVTAVVAVVVTVVAAQGS